MKIDFPTLKEPIYAHGRNGYFSATAINVLALPDDIRLENWTSKDAIGIGRVVLPADRNVVRDLANHLNRIADKLP
ncbi:MULTISPECIES: hypothetical protein [Mesorhizobium]|uniref:hypothetical protein n=1 Tax=Mesorhizobium TaxID=68287 RepID=UPI0007ECCA72|nr:MULTISPECIES: hypothetical protein [Mesorhizobium]PBB52542.1 hypothetical protein CK223_29325 [Mesorhizobium loti]QIA25526.1 hypothetical protein A9K68_030340 [Mesorhizobium sp. AA22]